MALGANGLSPTDMVSTALWVGTATIDVPADAAIPNTASGATGAKDV
jgi:hypothetical protein